MEYQIVKEANIYTKKRQIEQSDDQLSLIEEYKFMRKIDKWQELIMLNECVDALRRKLE